MQEQERNYSSKNKTKVNVLIAVVKMCAYKKKMQYNHKLNQK